MTESFREKILRKCGESVEMKEKFFDKYADEIDEMSRDMAKRFVERRATFRRWETAAACATRSTSRSNLHHPIIEKRAGFSRHLRS